MSKLIKYSFAAGVFARALHGRNDLEKYDLGLAAADNFFVDYRGGATSRPGFEFREEIETGKARLFPFMFNRNLSNTYLLVFTHQKVRFMQDGAFVLEAAKAIIGIAGNVVSVTAHGYATGDLVQISGRSYIVGTTTTNTFRTLNFLGGDETPVGTTVARVYTVATPYDEDDLAGLQFRQRRDMVRITSLDYEPRDLTRAGHTNWSLVTFTTGGASVASPAGLTAGASGAGSASINYAVTSVDKNGRESLLSDIKQLTGIVNYASDPGSVVFSWTPVAGARHYNVYRSLVFPNAGANSIGQELGYIGRSYSPSFVDTNIIPNFAITPPQYNNPFAAGKIDYITVTAGGTGYTSAPTVSVSGGGTGFKGLAVVESGAITAVVILNSGSGYTAPAVSFTGGGGSGAAATATVAPSTGLNPAVCIFYGQRMWLMGTTAAPLSLYSGRGDDLFSFSRSQLYTAADPLEYEIDSPELTPIRFAGQLLDNMFVFTDLGVWQVAPVDTGYASVQRTQNGIGRVPPLSVYTELLFTMPDGSGVRSIRPGQLANTYVDVDLAIFSGDYFKPELEIVSWGFARTPYRLVWASRADGKMLSFTYLPEHNVYAWTEHSTRGYVRDIAVVGENGIDRLYAIIERATGIFIERLAHRDFETVEDIFGSDSALCNDLTYPAASITVVLDGDFITITADSPVFSAGDIGSHFRAGGGKAIVTDFVSSTVLVAEVVIDIADREPQSDAIPPFAEGEWSLTAPFTAVSGLKHLRGQTVEVFADGSDAGTFTVSEDGEITLDVPASKVCVGLPYSGYVETLPLVASDAIIDDKVKNITGLALRLERTRGLEYGTQEHYYELMERTTERLDEPTRFQDGLRDVSVLADWRADGQVKIRKVGPGAVSLLGYIVDVEIGDDG